MYFATASGRKIDLTNLSSEDICLSDIAHHLTKICRYGGAMALDKHYSVASHSLNLCYYAMDNGMGKDVARACLMHDASEAYLGDLVTGLKCLLPDYKFLEEGVTCLIQRKYKLLVSEYLQDIVKELDTCIVLDEAAAFMPHYYNIFKAQLGDVEPLDINIHPDGAQLYLIKQAFLYTCETLDIRD